ncbi:40S ribosomal protein S6 [Dictyocoela muelleri]|nr:40S ribosomal protein S6 [Dictyocoela muelleri]
MEGFPMAKNLLTDKRQRLLLSKGMIGYRCRRDGCRKRKSVRGSIISSEIAALCVVVTKVGDNEIEGLTDVVNGVTHWPKRFRKLKVRAGFDPDSNVTIEQVKESIYSAVLEANDNDKRKLPKIRPTRVKTTKHLMRRELKKKISAERREKTKREREEFLKKYPEWENKVKN